MATILERLRSRKQGPEQAGPSRDELAAYPHLVAMKPKERYVFHSDYFDVDDSYVGCVLAFFHDDAARDTFVPFWGIDLIPHGLGEDVTTVLLEQVQRMGEGWIDAHQRKSDQLERMDSAEQGTSGTSSSRRKTVKASDDLATVAAEMQDGASYLNVHFRLFVKAPSLEGLDEAVERIGRLYIDRLGTIRAAAYPGEQRSELSSLLAPNDRKHGRGFYFTSTELAGSHMLVTQGLNDPSGEYVGYMVGDVNNSAVLFDTDNFSHHVVIAHDGVNPVTGRSTVASMWGSKLSQSALLNNHRVVHLILDGTNLDLLGPRFDGLTARVDLNQGDVNPFEMFGDVADELSIFPAHMQKLVLMAEQAYATTDDDRSVIRGSLEQVATKFYVDQNMWHRNAGANRQRLRVVGIPHQSVPRLQMFTTYLDSEYKKIANMVARDEELLHALSVLRLTFRNLLDNNGDLFNTFTSDTIDGARDGRRVIYDFGKLQRRGTGIAMAQLVNIVGFAVGSLDAGDLVVIHGSEHIDTAVKGYITTQLEQLHSRGGRVALLYNSVDRMIADHGFNGLDKADYSILGTMRESTAAQYKTVLAKEIPFDLERLVTENEEGRCYLRRGVDNVVFSMDLALGINVARKRRTATPPYDPRQVEPSMIEIGA